MNYSLDQKRAIAKAKAKVAVQKRSDALSSLAAGPPVVREEPIKQSYANVGGMPVVQSKGKKLIREDAKTFYARQIPAALGVSEDKFNPSKGVPFVLRAQMDALPTQSDRMAVLRSKYGEENVKSFNLNGADSIVFKHEDEWRMADPIGFEIADFTADIAGDLFPVGAGIGAGIAGLVAAAPTSPAGMLAVGATAAAGGEAVAGAAQDIAARKAFGLDANLKEIGKRRSMEAAFNVTADVFLSKFGGQAMKAIYGKQGSDVISKEIADFVNLTDMDAPTTMMLEGGSERVAEIASKFPNSAAAKLADDIRGMAGRNFEDVLGGVPSEQTDKVLRDGFETMTAQLKETQDNITRGLSEAAERKAELKGASKAVQEKKAAIEAKKAFNDELQSKAKNVLAKPGLSPEKTGRAFQDRMANTYLEKEIQSDKMWQQAYFDLQRENTSVDEIVGVFKRAKQDAFLDIKDDVIAAINPSALTASGRAANTLEELAEASAGQPVSFKQVNELLQFLEGRAKRGAKDRDPNARAFGQIANDLRSVRTQMLKKAPPEGRKSFRLANDYFKTDIIKFRESDIFRAIKPELGDSFTKAKDAIVKGEVGPRMPQFREGGKYIIDSALRNPKSVNDFLRSAGDSLESRKLLREAWLTKKGLEAGKPIPKSALKFSPDELDVVASLWTQSGGAGINRKVESLRRIAKFADKESDYIEGLTAETFERLMKEGGAEAQVEITKIGQLEVQQKAKLNKLNKDKIVKMMAKGELPLPDNFTSMESFGSSFLAASPGDAKAIIRRLGKENPDMLPALQKSVLLDLVTKAGRGTDAAQEATLGYSIWKPEMMGSLLKRNKDNLSLLLGSNEKYKNLVTYNNGLARFSTRAADPEGKLGSASSGKNISFFLSNVGGGVKDRLVRTALWGQLNSPRAFNRKLLTPDAYNRKMGIMMRNALMLRRGESFFEDADADPEFRKEMTEMYAEMLGSE